MKKVLVVSILFSMFNFSIARADVGLRHIVCYADTALKFWTYEGPYYVVSQDGNKAVLRDILRIENGRCVLSEPMTFPDSWCAAITTEILSNPPCVP
jgi:hypothetical protein